jgi:hypothetical protein
MENCVEIFNETWITVIVQLSACSFLLFPPSLLSPCLSYHDLMPSPGLDLTGAPIIQLPPFHIRTARWSTRRDPSLIQLCIPSGTTIYNADASWRVGGGQSHDLDSRGIDSGQEENTLATANLTICSLTP